MLDSSESHLLSYLALGVGVLCLGFSAIFVQWADAPGIVTACYRMLIAVVLMAVPFYRRAKAQDNLSRRGLQFAVLGGLFFACDVGSWATGVTMSGATNPTLLANTAPLWVGLGAIVIFREKLSRMFWVGLLLTMSGAVVILGLDTLHAASVGLGSLFGLLAGFFYGGYYLITQRGRETLDSLTYFWPAALTSALCLLALNLALGQPLTGYSTTTWLIFLAQGLISQVLGYLAINYALGNLPASLVAPTMLGQPVITAILAVLLLGESLAPWQIAGGVVVLVGIYIVHHGQQRIDHGSD